MPKLLPNTVYNKMLSMRNMKIRYAIAVVLFIGFLLPVVMAGTYVLRLQQDTLLDELSNEHNRLIDILVAGMREPLWTLFPEGGLPLINAIRTDERVVLVRVTAERGVFIESGRIQETTRPNVIVLTKEIVFHDRTLGTVTLAMDSSYLLDALSFQGVRYLLIFLIPFMLSAVILFLLMRWKIISPLENVLKQSEDIAKKRLEAPFIWVQRDEMGMLGHSLELTRQSLKAAFGELENSNDQLQKEIVERVSAEQKLRESQDVLEVTIQKRTQELTCANASLKNEIKEREKVEEARRKISLKLHRAEKMEALGILASSVAHDLNNILAGIVSYPELLLMNLDKESDLRKPLEDIQGAGKRAAEVVADLLTIARGTTTVFVPQNLNILLAEYLRSPEYDQLISNHFGVVVTPLLTPEEPVILCSSIHVKKCVMNLLTNAVEAAGETGTITIETSCVIEREQTSDGEVEHSFWVLSIGDNGTGIADPDREHIFEPFYSTKQMGMSGSGLGLAIVWNTMQDHGGKVTVESSPRGTCFKLYFPSTDQHVLVEQNCGTMEQYKGNGEHILVVDDETLLLTLASKMLERLGYQVSVCSSGEEAIIMLQTNSVAAVILDMVMEPGMSGLETYKQILKIHPEQKAMLVSGFAMNDDIQAGLDLGVTTFLKKPYSMAQFGKSLQLTLTEKS